MSGYAAYLREQAILRSNIRDITDLRIHTSDQYLTSAIGPRNTPITGTSLLYYPAPPSPHIDGHHHLLLPEDDSAPPPSPPPALTLSDDLENALVVLRLGLDDADAVAALQRQADALFDDPDKVTATPMPLLRRVVEADLRLRRAQAERELYVLDAQTDALKGANPDFVDGGLARLDARLLDLKERGARLGELVREKDERERMELMRERMLRMIGETGASPMELVARRIGMEEERLFKRGGRAMPPGASPPPGDAMDVDG